MPAMERAIPEDAVGFFGVVGKGCYWYGGFLFDNYAETAGKILGPRQYDSGIPEQVLRDQVEDLIQTTFDWFLLSEVGAEVQRRAVVEDIVMASSCIAMLTDCEYFMVVHDDAGVISLQKIEATSVAQAREIVQQHPDVQPIEATLVSMRQAAGCVP